MTEIVTLGVDSSDAEHMLFRLSTQLPFATSLAINETAKDFQRAETAHIFDVFEIRRSQFAKRAVKIKPFAHKRRLEAVVQIEPPGGRDRSDIFAKFEEGGVIRPVGHQAFALPDEVDRATSGVISKSKRPRAFQFQFVGTGKDGSKIYKGRRRTFMIRKPDGTGGIYQRIGQKGTRKRAGVGRALASDLGTRQVRDANIRTLYRFTPQARIDKRLEFIETGEDTVQVRFGPNFKDALLRAVGAKPSRRP